MNNWWKTLLDTLYPIFCLKCKQGTEWLCPSCLSQIKNNDSLVCVVCGRPAVGGYTHPGCRSRYTPDRLLAPLVFTGSVKELVKAIKYRHLTSAVAFAVELLLESLAEQGEHFGGQAVAVPVPIDWWRRVKRGYNQSELLAQALSKKLGLSCSSRCLRRRGISVSQTFLSRRDRHRNVQGKFLVPDSRKELVAGRDIVLVDDVVTTGATMLEAGRALKRAGARYVWGLALAQDVLGGRK